MFYKKIISTLLLVSLFMSCGVFAMDAVPAIPASDRIKKNGDRVLVYPTERSSEAKVWGCCGGVLSALGAALIIYGKVQRDKLRKELAQTTDEIKKTQLLQDIDNYEDYYWYGGIVGALGLLGFGVACIEARKNDLPVEPMVILDQEGVEADGKKIAWKDLKDVRSDFDCETYKSFRSDTSFDSAGRMHTTRHPETFTTTRKLLTFVPAKEPNRFSYCCDRDERNISISRDNLPISADAFVKLVKQYVERY